MNEKLMSECIDFCSFLQQNRMCAIHVSLILCTMSPSECFFSGGIDLAVKNVMRVSDRCLTSIQDWSLHCKNRHSDVASATKTNSA